MDSSSAGSPFSARSTSASSPEASGTAQIQGDQKQQQQQHAAVNSLSGALEGMMRGNQAVLPTMTNGNLPNAGQPSTSSHWPSISPRSSASPPAITKLQMTSSTSLPHASVPSNHSGTPLHSRVVSGSSHQGGVRTEPPKRKLEIEGLPVQSVPSDELVRNAEMNRMLLQGDSQHITKQRVETAIRVIIDILRLVPRSPSSPPMPEHLHQLLIKDASGQPLTSLERIDTFRAIRLQAGTTTKISSKKQQQAGPTPADQLIYLQTAVYTSGDKPRRVYACKRCRMRELKRKQNKEANRKKQHTSNSESDSSAAQNPRPSVKGISPSADYITGENPDQYDPQKHSQVVEEPVWDPRVNDWRNEMVLFNSTPEVPMKDGSCVWLPFRVICYGKCHGEKLGFIVRFTFRLASGEVIVSATTPPIRITDDHKTDVTKVKPAPGVPRPRKTQGRMSTASSRRQSPAASEAESIQSVSEAGVVKQKQTPQVRTKPYQRPNGPTPPTNNNDFHRSVSTTSVPSMPSMSGMSLQDQQSFQAFAQQLGGLTQPSGTLSPGIYNGAQPFDFSGFDGSVFEPNAYPTSASQSAPSSNLASPLSGPVPLGREDVMLGSGGNMNQQSPLGAGYMNNLNNLPPLSLQPSHGSLNQMSGSMFSPFNGQNTDVDMSNPVTNSLDNLFDTASHASLTSDYNDNNSVFSSNVPDGSLFSDSGLVPDDMQGFLDLTGGEGDSGGGMTSMRTNFYSPSSQNVNMQSLSPDSQTRQMLLAALGQTQQQQPNSNTAFSSPPVQPQNLNVNANIPRINTIIPSEGPVAGGTTVAVIGSDFVQGTVILFGDRAAKVQVVQPGFIQCQAPPAIGPGHVEVSISGTARPVGAQAQMYKYNMMDTDLMMLALQVKDQYAGSSNDAAYRLAQHVAARTQNPGTGNWSEHSNQGHGSGHQPQQHQAQTRDGASTPASDASSSSDIPISTDLQATIISFLASLDEQTPGSLRRSGAINHRNGSEQTMLHIATVMGYHRLVRRLIVIGAHLDLQDVNGYTALGLASLMGKTACVRVLIQAGAAYDRPTAFGEMPLDLAKIGEHQSVETLLLSAVWSTVPEKTADSSPDSETSLGFDTGSEIDDDNPSSGTSDVDEVSKILSSSRKGSRRISGKGKQAATNANLTRRRPSTSSSARSRQSNRSGSDHSHRSSLSDTPQPTPVLHPSTPPDAPPPYDSHARSGPATTTSGESGHHDLAPWMSNLYPGAFKLPGAVWDKIPQPITSFLDKTLPMAGSSSSTSEADGVAASGGNGHNGWIAFPVPSWDTIHKMTSPEEVKMFTQAMAAMAFNAVIQSGATTGNTEGRPFSESKRNPSDLGEGKRSKHNSSSSGGMRRRRRSKGAGGVSASGGGGGVMDGGGAERESIYSDSPGSPKAKVVNHVKRDRMLYLFWLPVLLFVGFWLLVTALPLATGFCLIYARQITRAIKQRM